MTGLEICSIVLALGTVMLKEEKLLDARLLWRNKNRIELSC